MRKRLIIINSLVVVFALLFSLVFNIVNFTSMNYNNTKQELSNYLNVAVSVYDTGNEEEVIHLFDDSSKAVRVTVIDFDGNVIADSSKEDISTNHLYREEIKSLGKFVERKSTSLGVNMLYVAARDDNAYVRVALEVSSIDQYVWAYVLSDGLATVVLLALSIGVVIILLRKYLTPLSVATKKLEAITNETASMNNDSMESLILSIDKAGDTISSQMCSLKEEKDKILFIINHISQGLLIINNNNEVELVNDFAVKVLDLDKEKITGKNYLYCFRNQEVNENIARSRETKNVLMSEITLNGLTYQVSINHFDDKVAVLLTDITKLKNLENTKREFFENASHELKSPLTSIIGYQQMIKEGIIVDEDEIKDATAKTIVEANRMNNLIIEMLDLSKLETNRSNELETLSLKEEVEDMVSQFENKIENKHINVKLDLEDCEIEGNKEHVDTVIKNLIDNAIKYNKDGGCLFLTLKGGTFSVEDTGIGIEEKNLSRIFERFYRVDKAKSKALGSTGLGLAIVKHICQMYDYEINVSSSIGQGTRFDIKFMK